MDFVVITKANFVHNPHRLLTELLAIPELQPAGGIFARVAVASSGTTAYIAVPTTFDPARLDAIYAAHNSAPDDPPLPLPDYGADEQPRAQLSDAVTNLRAYLQLASPTNAQTISAFKLLIRVVLFLCRRVVLA